MDINDCKKSIKQLLLDTDYAMLEDVLIDNKEEFKHFRSYLRALLISEEQLILNAQVGVNPADHLVVPEPVWTQPEETPDE